MGRLITAFLIVLLTALPAQASEGQFLQLLNSERAEAVVMDSNMSAYARNWSQQMAANNKLEHSGLGYAENVGVGFSVTNLHNGFVQSPDHYANMTNPRWDTVGIGQHTDGEGRIWVTVLFADLQQPPPPEPEPTQAPEPTEEPKPQTVYAPSPEPVVYNVPIVDWRTMYCPDSRPTTGVCFR